jgi:hypothetical protein
MPDGSVYYGELEWFNPKTQDLTYNYDEVPDKQKVEYKRVRHGYGIQLFGRGSNE